VAGSQDQEWLHQGELKIVVKQNVPNTVLTCISIFLYISKYSDILQTWTTKPLQACLRRWVIQLDCESLSFCAVAAGPWRLGRKGRFDRLKDLPSARFVARFPELNASPRLFPFISKSFGKPISLRWNVAGSTWYARLTGNLWANSHYFLGKAHKSAVAPQTLEKTNERKRHALL